MKRTSKTANGTSFFRHTFSASVNQLKDIMDEPIWEQNDGSDKVNFEWNMETEDGDIFTVYDWKEYRELDLDETIEWHIGGHNEAVTLKAKMEIESELAK